MVAATRVLLRGATAARVVAADLLGQQAQLAEDQDILVQLVLHNKVTQVELQVRVLEVVSQVEEEVAPEASAVMAVLRVRNRVALAELVSVPVDVPEALGVPVVLAELEELAVLLGQ